MKKIELTDERKQDYFYNEAIKTLRTNILLSGKSVKTILITSCFPNEGKSDITISLAQELGSIGKRVLLLDADIRKSALISRFGVAEEVRGLSEYLSGQTELKDLICATNYENLDIIFGGPMAPNPSGLLSEKLFRNFLKELREYYDYILIDTPPIANIIDAAVVAENCDGAVLVVEAGAVSYKVAQKAVKQLERTGCQILGSVLNKVDTKKDKYYSSYYRRYGSYYKKSENKEYVNKTE